MLLLLPESLLCTVLFLAPASPAVVVACKPLGGGGVEPQAVYTYTHTHTSMCLSVCGCVHTCCPTLCERVNFGGQELGVESWGLVYFAPFYPVYVILACTCITFM